MASRLQNRFADEAKANGLLVSEFEGSVTGIGTRDELQALIDDGIMPAGTTLREATAEDF